MNTHVGRFDCAEAPRGSTDDRATETSLPQAWIVPISETVSAVMFDAGPGGATQADRRLRVHLDGVPVAGPLISSRLELRAGGLRQVLLLRCGARVLAERRVTVAVGGVAVAGIDPTWLQPPVVDGLSLIDGLSEAAQRRLLKLFLTTGASMFGFDAASELGPAMRALLDQLGVTMAQFASAVPIGRAGRIVSFRVPEHWSDPEINELVAQERLRVSRVAGFELRIESGARGALAHVYLPGAVAQGATLIGLGEKPVLLPPQDAGASAQPLVPWLANRDGATRAWVRGLLDRTAPGDEIAAAIRRELAPGADADLRVRHLSATPGGLLYALEIRDPQNLVRAVRIERGTLGCDIAPPTGAARVLAGFADLGAAGGIEVPVRIRLVYHSGRVRAGRALAPAAFDGHLPQGLGDCDPEMLAPALAQAHRSMARRDASARVAEIGRQPLRPRIALVAAVGDNLDIVRARAALLAREPGAAQVESIYHHGEGETAAAARRVIAGAHAVFGLPFRIVTLDASANASERLRAALCEASADLVLVLGADVLPEGPGWLAAWVRALGRKTAPDLIGGTLLAGGAVADAGGTITFSPGSAPEMRKRHAGLPARDLPAAATLATDLVSAACVGMTRLAVDMLCRSASVYPHPDILLTEVAARLREDGRPARTDLRLRFDSYRASAGADPVDALADRHALGALVREGRS